VAAASPGPTSVLHTYYLQPMITSLTPTSLFSDGGQEVILLGRAE
jgi:hypothetical protein